MQKFCGLLHRDAGLSIAFFLTVAGRTGSGLALSHALNAWLHPQWYDVPLQIRLTWRRWRLTRRRVV